MFCFYIQYRSQVEKLIKKVHLVDALVLEGDEGRNTLRKVSGSRE
jgi:hypothetical protein